MSRVLVIAVHPDDETIGCGGTILKHRSNDDFVSWVTFTNEDRPTTDIAHAYDFDLECHFKYPTAKLESIGYQSMIERLWHLSNKVKPNIVYIPNASDIHTDHKIVHQVCVSVFKSFYMKSLEVKRVLVYEVLSETDAAPFYQDTFRPNMFVDITPFIDKKLEIMSMYNTEVHKYPGPRSLETIRALAKYRGGTVNMEYAEAFMLMRELI